MDHKRLAFDEYFTFVKQITRDTLFVLYFDCKYKICDEISSYFKEKAQNLDFLGVNVGFKIIMEKPNLWFYLRGYMVHDSLRLNFYSNSKPKIPSEALKFLKRLKEQQHLEI